jgi:phosphoglycerate dehydrogenase-like enzyme
VRVQSLISKVFFLLFRLGDIGMACARLAHSYQMKVKGLRRKTQITSEEAKIVVGDHRGGLNPRGPSHPSLLCAQDPEHFDTILDELNLLYISVFPFLCYQDEIYAPQDIAQLMSVSDYVVISMPYTPQTLELVSAAAIGAMKPHGVLINVGRGKTVDEEALIEALSNGRIRGAALDVFAIEPLPTDSLLWTLDNVLMSPHCADRTKDFQIESLELFVQNMKRYLDKDELLNICDKRSGY